MKVSAGPFKTKRFFKYKKHERLIIMAQKEERVSFIRLDNANLIKMNFAGLAKRFAEYSQNMIDIKKLSDQKIEKKKGFREKIREVEKKILELEALMPKEPEAKKIEKKLEKHEKAAEIEVQGELGSFASLRDEFERLRYQLEDIKKTL